MSTKKACHCPYCDEPIVPPGVPCEPCSVEIEYCPDCGKPLPKGSKECPQCSGHPAGEKEKHT